MSHERSQGSTAETAAIVPGDILPRHTTRSLPGVLHFSAGTSAERPAPEPIHDRYALFLEFQPLVHRLTGQYGEDPEFRQDLAGEIYLRFCALLDAYDPHRGVPLRGYLVRQLSASIYTYARCQWRQKRREASLEEIPEDLRRSDLDDPTRRWDDELMSRDIAALLPKAIGHLTERQARIVLWRYDEGRSHEEIAEMLGIRPASVRSLLRHALGNLRRWFAQQSLTATDGYLTT